MKTSFRLLIHASIFGLVCELLINSEKASTSFLFEINNGGVLCLRFSITHAHYSIFRFQFSGFSLDFPFLIFSLHQKNPYTHHFFRLAKLKLDPCLFHNFLQVDSHGFRGKMPELRLYAFTQIAPLALVAGTGSEQMGVDKAFPESFLFQLEHITNDSFWSSSQASKTSCTSAVSCSSTRRSSFLYSERIFLNSSKPKIVKTSTFYIILLFQFSKVRDF